MNKGNQKERPYLMDGVSDFAAVGERKSSFLESRTWKVCVTNCNRGNIRQKRTVNFRIRKTKLVGVVIHIRAHQSVDEIAERVRGVY